MLRWRVRPLQPVAAGVVCMVLWVECLRDWVLIIWGLLSIIMVVMIILFVFAMWRGIKGLIGNIQVVVKDDVRPMIAISRESVNSVAGTTRFMSDTVVNPVIRAYGVLSGVRRGFGVFTGLTGRGKGDGA